MTVLTHTLKLCTCTHVVFLILQYETDIFKIEYARSVSRRFFELDANVKRRYARVGIDQNFGYDAFEIEQYV